MGLTQTDIDEISIAFDRNGALNNVEIREAFQKILDGGSGSASGVYLAMLTQSGTAAPTAVELVNTLGTVNFDREDAGTYFVTSANLFTSGKTVVTAYNGYDKHIRWTYAGSGEMQIFTGDDAGFNNFVDDVLDGISTYIKIEVY
jgi:hypothetical protein